MKIYNSIEEFRNDWNPEKQLLYNQIIERKYGKLTKTSDSMLLISDSELSELIGTVRFNIPINTK